MSDDIVKAQMKKRFDSKGKGNGYERVVAGILSPWVGLKLIRTPMSGAWPGSSGDIIPEARGAFFPFTIECKKREDWDFDQILAGKGQFYRWLEQAEAESNKDEAINGGRKPLPLVVFTRNYKADYIAIPVTDVWLDIGLTMIQLVHRDIHWQIVQLRPFIEKVPYSELLVWVP